MTTPVRGSSWRAAFRALLAMIIVTAGVAQGAYALFDARSAAAVAFGAGSATLVVVYTWLRPGMVRRGPAAAALLWVGVAAVVAGARLLLAR